MRDITKEINIYRECVRNIWNIHFLNLLTSENDFDLIEEFNEISTMLFSSLLLNRIGYGAYRKPLLSRPKVNPLHFLVVIPSIESGTPIHINREHGKNKQSYWDYPVNFIMPGEIEMRFVDLFDYNQFGFRDFEFIFVNITGSTKDKKLIGRNALLKVCYAKVLFYEGKVSV